MMLRSAANLPTKHTENPISVGNFIELRSDDPNAKPWLARVITTTSTQSDTLDTTHESRSTPLQDIITEVECEWLWHPKDSIRDFNLEGIDPTVYGTREVFLGGGSGETMCDWNPIDSIKWQVHIFPLDKYLQLAASGFQASLSGEVFSTPTSRTKSQHMTILDPNRCWYYRQTLNAETHDLVPPLECVIHRPNPVFHEWCIKNGTQIDSIPLLDPSDSSIQACPPRTLLVPENPERIYFHCTGCLRRFETRQGDRLHLSQINDPKLFRLKTQINQSDIDFICPTCESSRSMIGTHNDQTLRIEDNSPPSKRAKTSSIGGTDLMWNFDSVPTHQFAYDKSVSDDWDTQRQSDEARREEKRKLTRYERFNDIFKKAIEDTLVTSGTTTNSSFLKYTDSKTLCDEFFDEFEAYLIETQLNPKMGHQKLHEIFQNLKRDNNINLRRRVVTGELLISELVRSDAKDLAPDSLKRRREAEAQKYFKQQVLLPSDPAEQKLIRKTHKGLEAIMDEDDIVYRSPTRIDTLNDEQQLTLTDQSASHYLSNDGTQSSLQDNEHGTTVSFNTPLSTKDIVLNHINSLIKKKMTDGPPDSDLLNLSTPLYNIWKNSSINKDSQMIPPPQYHAVPNRSQTLSLLTYKLSSINNSEKLILDLRKYAHLSTMTVE